MKEVALNILFILYGFVSMAILFIAILFPLVAGTKECPYWIAWIVYPLALLIMASQRLCFEYFHKKFNPKTQ